MKQPDDPTSLDYFFGGEIVDMATAHFKESKVVVELAQRYTQQFREFTGYLDDAKNLAQKDAVYREDVKTSRSRDCFLLLLGTNIASKVVTQLQARLEFEGLKQPALGSVSEELLRAQKEYRSAFNTFREAVSSA